MAWDALLKLWRWGSAVSLAGVVQFLVCLVLAMQWYAGGNPLAPRAVGYSFFGNYLSDLGRTVAWSGSANSASAGLFNISLVILAVAQVPFYLFLPLHAVDRLLHLSLAAVLGLVSCVGLAGVGLAPYDLYLRAHITWLLWWIVPLVLVLLIHAWAILGSEECSPWLALISLGLALLVAAYAIRTAAWGLPPQMNDDSEALLKTIALQKYVLLGCVGWYAVFSVRMLLLMRRPQPRGPSRHDEVAAQYLRRLGG